MVRQRAPTWPPPSPLLLNNNNNIWVPNLLPPYCITPFLPPPFTSCKNLPRPSSSSIFRGIEGMVGGGVKDLFQGLLKNCHHCGPVQTRASSQFCVQHAAPPPFLKNPLHPAASCPPWEGAPAPSSSPQERGESWELTLLLPRSYSWVWSLRKKTLQVGAREVGKQRKRKYIFFILQFNGMMPLFLFILWRIV